MCSVRSSRDVCVPGPAPRRVTYQTARHGACPALDIPRCNCKRLSSGMQRGDDRWPYGGLSILMTNTTTAQNSSIMEPLSTAQPSVKLTPDYHTAGAIPEYLAPDKLAASPDLPVSFRAQRCASFLSLQVQPLSLPHRSCLGLHVAYHAEVRKAGRVTGLLIDICRARCLWAVRRWPCAQGS
jgi:hypothetical protein